MLLLTAVCCFMISNNAAAEPQKGGTIVYAAPTTTSKLDPPYTVDNMDEEVVLMIYDKLVWYRPPGLKIEGQLAEKYESSSDGLTWTFWLRKGIKFHDGTDLDADAVKFNFDRWMGPEKPFRAANLFAPIVKSVEVADRFTLRIHLHTPFSSFLPYLCHPAASIVSPTHFRKYKADNAVNPCGSGPFKFKEWIKGDHLTLVRNESYFKGAPYLDAIIVKPVSEETTRVMQVQTGQIHATTQISSENIPRLKSNPRLEVSTTQQNATNYIIINTQRKPFTDVRVRRAMNFAVDKEAIVRDLFLGMADRMSGVNAPVVQGAYQPPPYEYNPEKARTLLAEAGYPKGFACSLWTMSGRFPKDIEVSQLVQRYLGEVGIKVQVQAVEMSTLTNDTRVPPDKAKFDMFFAKWSPSTGEARWQFYLAWTRKNWPMAGNNRAFYSNPEFEKLVDQGTVAPTEELRNQYYKEAQTILAADAPYIPICSPHRISVTSKKLHGFVFGPLEQAFATNETWLEK